MGVLDYLKKQYSAIDTKVGGYLPGGQTPQQAAAAKVQTVTPPVYKTTPFTQQTTPFTQVKSVVNTSQPNNQSSTASTTAPKSSAQGNPFGGTITNPFQQTTTPVTTPSTGGVVMTPQGGVSTADVQRYVETHPGTTVVTTVSGGGGGGSSTPTPQNVVQTLTTAPSNALTDAINANKTTTTGGGFNKTMGDFTQPTSNLEYTKKTNYNLVNQGSSSSSSNQTGYYFNQPGYKTGFVGSDGKFFQSSDPNYVPKGYTAVKQTEVVVYDKNGNPVGVESKAFGQSMTLDSYNQKIADVNALVEKYNKVAPSSAVIDLTKNTLTMGNVNTYTTPGKMEFGKLQTTVTPSGLVITDAAKYNEKYVNPLVIQLNKLGVPSATQVVQPDFKFTPQGLSKQLQTYNPVPAVAPVKLSFAGNVAQQAGIVIGAPIGVVSAMLGEAPGTAKPSSNPFLSGLSGGVTAMQTLGQKPLTGLQNWSAELIRPKTFMTEPGASTTQVEVTQARLDRAAQLGENVTTWKYEPGFVQYAASGLTPKTVGQAAALVEFGALAAAATAVAPTVTAAAFTGLGGKGVYDFFKSPKYSEEKAAGAANALGIVSLVHFVPRISGSIRSIGRTEIPTEKLIPPKTLSGEEAYPLAPTREHLRLFQEFSQRLPGERPTISPSIMQIDYAKFNRQQQLKTGVWGDELPSGHGFPHAQDVGQNINKIIKLYPEFDPYWKATYGSVSKAQYELGKGIFHDITKIVPSSMTDKYTIFGKPHGEAYYNLWQMGGGANSITAPKFARPIPGGYIWPNVAEAVKVHEALNVKSLKYKYNELLGRNTPEMKILATADRLDLARYSIKVDRTRLPLSDVQDRLAGDILTNRYKQPKSAPKFSKKMQREVDAYNKKYVISFDTGEVMPRIPANWKNTIARSNTLFNEGGLKTKNYFLQQLESKRFVANNPTMGTGFGTQVWGQKPIPGTAAKLFHTTGDIFWKKGITEINAGTSEVPSLYGAPFVSPRFLRLDRGEYGFIWNLKDMFRGLKPGVLAITPEKGFEVRVPQRVKPYVVDGQEFKYALPDPKTLEAGKAYVFKIKTEVEAGLPPIHLERQHAGIKLTNKEYFFKYPATSGNKFIDVIQGKGSFGVKVPLDEAIALNIKNLEHTQAVHSNIKNVAAKETGFYRGLPSVPPSYKPIGFVGPKSYSTPSSTKSLYSYSSMYAPEPTPSYPEPSPEPRPGPSNYNPPYEPPYEPPYYPGYEPYINPYRPPYNPPKYPGYVPPVRPLEEIPTYPKPKSSDKLYPSRKKKKGGAFDILIKRRGKWYGQGVSLSERQAGLLAQKRLTQSLAASAMIVPTRKPLQRSEVLFAPKVGQFRQYNIRKGTKIFNPRLFIQETGSRAQGFSRLGSTAERREIKLYPNKKRKGGFFK
jgi:hypothetical protein